jgi:hypothetical protein
VKDFLAQAMVESRFPSMHDSGKEAIQAYVARWQRAAPVLEKVRDADIRSANTAEAMKSYAGSANWAVAHRPSPATSGLVEQQRWFMKLLHRA